MGDEMICPMCDSGDLELTSIDKDKSDGREDKCFIWVCNECPAILIEWWDSSDTKAFNQYMSKDTMPIENLSFWDIYKEYQNYNYDLDEIEKGIKAILPGPETENSSWVDRAKSSNSVAVKMLFERYEKLYHEMTRLTNKTYKESGTL